MSLLKKPKSYEEQIKLLRHKNLCINDEDVAKGILKQTGYYRLSGYYSFFYKTSDNSKKFMEGTTIEEVYNLYRLDGKLRSILFELTSFVEIQLKSNLGYYLAHNYGEECWRNSSAFSQEQRLYILDKIKKSDSKVIQHHNEKYDGHYPIWVVLEILPFGSLMAIMHGLTKDEQKIISREYDFKPHYVISWLESVYKLRNNCAHHERIIGRTFKVKLDKHMKTYSQKDSLFILILAIKRLLKNNLDDWTFIQLKLKDLLDDKTFSSHNGIILKEKLGFPTNWYEILSREDL